jgi:hypothetical protein
VVNVPSQPEIITVNSEDLQTQIRDLLPSQNGFGSELQASNVIFPIIDLTRSADIYKGLLVSEALLRLTLLTQRQQSLIQRAFSK